MHSRGRTFKQDPSAEASCWNGAAAGLHDEPGTAGVYVEPDAAGEGLYDEFPSGGEGVYDEFPAGGGVVGPDAYGFGAGAGLDI